MPKKREVPTWAKTLIDAAVTKPAPDPLEHARRLRAQEQAGKVLTPALKAYWRTALAREMAAEGQEP
jgi:hypothetical protein